ncbi:hypothetical protein RND71_035846 [Anisodus tanguticus]|uniref:Uncharacterized protein n=1 Tax=Anisodus tanguticus TaxID=243964 RepID=A0AAE1V2J6_9SOLA|nr:hypothetical protein RND71_035846 [Anisodus tanguticus]
MLDKSIKRVKHHNTVVVEWRIDQGLYLFPQGLEFEPKLLHLKGSLGITGGHGFKSWKQPLAEMQGEIICENLPTNVCSFSIALSGNRCLLENSKNEDGKMEYQCKTSEVIVGNIAQYIETDECVNACGVDRSSVGISSDALLEPQFTAKLCSPACYQNCPNVVDLYFNLAAGEGVYLPDLCNKQRNSPHRAMIELLSSGAAMDALAPIASQTVVVGAPDISPASF